MTYFVLGLSLSSSSSFSSLFSLSPNNDSLLFLFLLSLLFDIFLRNNSPLIWVKGLEILLLFEKSGIELFSLLLLLLFENKGLLLLFPKNNLPENKELLLLLEFPENKEVLISAENKDLLLLDEINEFPKRDVLLLLLSLLSFVFPENRP